MVQKEQPKREEVTLREVEVREVKRRSKSICGAQGSESSEKDKRVVKNDSQQDSSG